MPILIGKKPKLKTFNADPAFYYYKRWLWMIFPWACLSEKEKCTYPLKININFVKDNYSDQIMSCYSSATKYISVAAEEKYTKKALKIALEAKLKKKMMYAKKEELEEQMESLRRMKKSKYKNFDP